jgi:hypothetical protein
LTARAAAGRKKSCGGCRRGPGSFVLGAILLRGGRNRHEEALMTIISGARVATPTVSTFQLWIGRGLSALFVLFMVGDTAIKLLQLGVVADALKALGYAPELGLPIGILQAVLLLLYLVTRTSVLGAVLFTGLFGGAFAAHLRTNSPFFTHDMFGVYLGVLAWAGLWLRDTRLRALLPLRR